MTLKKKLNAIRGVIMRRLTRNIGTAYTGKNSQLLDNTTVKRILICRPNHRLGNLLLITPLLQEVADTFPNAKIDLFIKGNLGPTLFKNYNTVDQIIGLPRKPFKDLPRYIGGWISIMRRRYDIVINTVNSSASGRLSTKFTNAQYKFFGDVDDTIRNTHADHGHMAKYPVYSFRRQLEAVGFRPRQQPVAPLDLKLTVTEIAHGKTLLQNLTKHAGKIICLFTYATDMKRYGPDWWTPFYERLRQEYTDYTFLEVLPVENVSQLDFRIPTYYSQDIREIGSVLANADIFIGADSGMMHLSCASGTPTVGLFKVTDIKGYEPYGNRSYGILTTTSNTDDWIRTISQALAIPVGTPAQLI